MTYTKPEADPLQTAYQIARSGATQQEPDWELVKRLEAQRARLRARFRKEQTPLPERRERRPLSDRAKAALTAWRERQPFRLPKGEELAEMYPDYRADIEQHRKERRAQYAKVSHVRPGAPRQGEG